MNNPLVSVIIPNYNHAKYLDQRIQSVLNQTYKNYEVIILDDNSPDNGASRDVIEKYRNNPHVSHIVYNDVNSGSTFKQWEKGFKLAKGEYIWIAESDDFCEYNLLQELVTVHTKNENISFAYSPVVYVDSEGKPYYYPYVDNTVDIVTGIDFLKYYLLLGCAVQNASCALINSSSLKKIVGKYLEFSSAGDYMFFTELSEKGDVGIIRKHLSYWRRHKATVTSRADTNGLNFYAEKKIVDYICNSVNGVTSKIYHIACDMRLKRIYDICFDSEAIKEDVLKLWSYNEVVRCYERFSQYDQLLIKCKMRVMYVSFIKDVYINDNGKLICNGLEEIRRISKYDYIKLLTKLFYEGGYSLLKTNYEYVCLVRGVHSNPFQRLLSSLRVLIGRLL